MKRLQKLYFSKEVTAWVYWWGLYIGCIANAYSVFEWVDFCRLCLQLMFYLLRLVDSNYFNSNEIIFKVCKKIVLQTLNVIYQSYPKSTKILVWTQNMLRHFRCLAQSHAAYNRNYPKFCFGPEILINAKFYAAIFSRKISAISI